MGTDHGDAAPLMLFGSCVSNGIVGSNPIIPNQINNQAGLPMQIDFRDIYASLLKDWFEVDPNTIQSLFEQSITYYDLLQGCSNAIDEQAHAATTALVYPNPSFGQHHLQFMAQSEHYQIYLLDQSGKIISKVLDQHLQQGQQILAFEIQNLSPGMYHYLIKSTQIQKLVSFQKM
jgi:hypothetical protein